MYGSTSCSYNGITSESMGVILVKIEHVDNYETAPTNRELIADRIQRANHKPQTYFYKIDRSPRRFYLELACETMTETTKSNLINWLFIDNYAPFIAGDDPNRIYYCIAVGEPKFWTNGQGCYISLEMQCQDEYSYSPIITKEFDLSEIEEEQEENEEGVILINSGDVSAYPILEIEVIESESTIKITNTTTNKYIQFSTENTTPLVAGEKITIDNYKELIMTNQLSIFRYDNMTGNFLELVKGINTFIVEGKCKLKFMYQNRYLH